MEEEILLLPGKVKQRIAQTLDGADIAHLASSVVLASACGVALLARFSSLLLFLFGIGCGIGLLLVAQVRFEAA